MNPVNFDTDPVVEGMLTLVKGQSMKFGDEMFLIIENLAFTS